MGKKRILWLNEISPNDKENIGEKAFLLSKAYNKKEINSNLIPEGFIITKNAINSFLDESKIKKAILNIIEETNINNLEEINGAESKISELINKTNFSKELTQDIIDSYEDIGFNKLEIEKGSAYDILTNSQEPIFVSVRVSNNENIGNSYYCIKGNLQVIATIKKCIKSLFSKENIKKIKEKTKNIENITTAILIQKQIESDKSGTVYIDDTYKIKAIWGLGGGLKQEEIKKDNYEIRRDGRILKKEINEKQYAITRNSSGNLRAVQLKEGYSFGQVLEEYEMQKLGDIGLSFEDLFEKHIEFDFAIEDNEIYVVSIKEKLEKKKEKRKEIQKEETIIFEEKEKKTKEQIINFNKIEPIENITTTKVGLIIETEEDREKSKDTLVKEGLINIEKIIKERGIHPLKYIENYNTKGYEEVLFSGISKIAKDLKTTWVKLSDFTTKDFEKLDGAKEEKEENPLMGLTGIKFLLSYPELLKREIKAINSINKEKENVGLLIPKISSVYEIKKVKEFTKELDSNIKVGIILETPASIQLIKDLIEEGIDAAFFSGDNLTKYLLAIDPNNKNVNKFYDNTSPALMYQLEYIIRVCKRRNIYTAFYGEATKNKEMVEYLIKKGIDKIFSNPNDINKLYNEIKSAEKKHIEGTDKEKRQYEITKEKERQKKELEEFKKIKEKQIKEEIELIEKEKEEYLKENPQEIITNHKKEQEEKTKEEIYTEEKIEEEKIKYLKENPQEIKEEKVNPHQGLPSGTEKKPNSIEEAIKLIDEHNSQKPKETDVEKAIKEIEEHNKKDKEIEKIKDNEILEIEEDLPEDIEELELIEDEDTQIQQEVLFDPTTENLKSEETKETPLFEEENFEDNITKLLNEEDPKEEKKDDPLGIF